MAEVDALRDFDFSKVTGAGLFLKFEAGKPLVLRVLTTDPVVYQDEYTDADDEVTLSTKFAFVVYNFTDKKAQILQATPNMAKKIGSIHTDPDFGGNIRKVDIKISPTGEKLQRRYDIQVLPKANELTNDMIEEARKIDLEEVMADKHGTRMSFWDPEKQNEKSGYEKAKEVANSLRDDDEPQEPINIDDIPF